MLACPAMANLKQATQSYQADSIVVLSPEALVVTGWMEWFLKWNRSQITSFVLSRTTSVGGTTICWAEYCLFARVSVIRMVAR